MSRIRPLFCDLMNLARGKYVSEEVAKGGRVGFARATFATTYDRDLLTVPGTKVMEGVPDMDLILDGDLRPGWQENTQIALGDIHVDGAPFALDARSQLKRTVAEWQAHGLSPMVGLELEAYVFQRDQDGVYRPYDTPGAHVYGTGPQNDPKGLLDGIWAKAEAMGLPLESLNAEYDNGQFELVCRFADAVTACDNTFLMRLMAQEEAIHRGLILTFLPKPIPDRGGSGVHVNFSFADKDGKNAVAPTGELSDLAKGCIAGLGKHHEGLAGILAPTVNSYDRLGPGSMAGYWANWGYDHRMTTTRCTVENPKSARLEHRMADGGCNPYLATHAVLQAARLGFEAKLTPPAAEDLDAIENTRARVHAPAGLSKALDALERNKDLYRAISPDLCEAHLHMKRDEITRLRGKSPQEIRDYYLPFI